MLLALQSDKDTAILTLNGRRPTEIESFPRTAHRAAVLELRAVPPDGMTFEVRIEGCGGLIVRLIDRSHDLELPSLPPDTMTAWEDDPYNRSVTVTRLLRFP